LDLLLGELEEKRKPGTLLAKAYASLARFAHEEETAGRLGLSGEKGEKKLNARPLEKGHQALKGEKRGHNFSRLGLKVACLALGGRNRHTHAGRRVLDNKNRGER